MNYKAMIITETGPRPLLSIHIKNHHINRYAVPHWNYFIAVLPRLRDKHAGDISHPFRFPRRNETRRVWLITASAKQIALYSHTTVKKNKLLIENNICW